jgi:hypothetical protein
MSGRLGRGSILKVSWFRLAGFDHSTLPYTFSGRERRNKYVVGWAKIIGRNRNRILRQPAASVLASRVYQSMYTGARRVMSQLKETQAAAKTISSPTSHLQVPRPDSHFLNAMLRVLGRTPTLSSKKRTSRGQHIRVLQHKRVLYAQLGCVPSRLPPVQHEMLRGLRTDMEHAGYRVPIGILTRFVGEEDSSMVVATETVVQIPRQPKMWPWARKKFDAHLIVTYKKRGLPVRT